MHIAIIKYMARVLHFLTKEFNDKLTEVSSCIIDCFRTHIFLKSIFYRIYSVYVKSWHMLIYLLKFKILYFFE